MIKKAFTVILTVLFCLIMLEIGLRAIGRRPTNMSEGIADQDGDSFRLKKNITKIMRFPAFSYTVHTNEYGFRDRSTGSVKLDGRPFAIFLGASDVFGNGVDFEDSFVGIFAAEASQNGWTVLNLAVGGHYFLDQEHLLREFMESTGRKPTAIFFCVNALHIPKFDQRNQHVIVKGGHVMNRNGWRNTYLRLLAGNASSAFCFFRDGIRRIQEKWFKYELNTKSPEFLDIFSSSNKMRSPERIKAFEEYLVGFESFCQRNDIELVYVYLPLSDSFRLDDMVRGIGGDPDDYDVSFYEDLMRSHCERTAQGLISVRPILQRSFDSSQALRFKLDPHFNAFANRVIGNDLIRGARQLRLLEGTQ